MAFERLTFPRDVCPIATGGNALIPANGDASLEGQFRAVAPVADLIDEIQRMLATVTITFGNGPQVGFIDERNTYAYSDGILHPVPLDFEVGDTQVGIGTIVTRLLHERFMKAGRPDLAARVNHIVTHIFFDPEHPSHKNPQKELGNWLTAAQASLYEERYPHWTIDKRRNEDPDRLDRFYRRLVGSPPPEGILEMPLIVESVVNDNPTVDCVGGGIPLAKDGEFGVRGLEIVGDKDAAWALKVKGLLEAGAPIRRGAIFSKMQGVILPDVHKEHGMRGAPARLIRVSEGRQMLPDWQDGNMRPKARAALDVAALGVPVCVTDLDPRRTRAAIFDGPKLDGEFGGTWFVHDDWRA